MKTKPSTPSDDVHALLGEDRPPRWWQRPLLWGAVLAVAVFAGGGYYYLSAQKSKAAPSFVTESLRTGDLTLTVSANGTLQPTRLVNVGSELSGTVREVLVDKNDRVKKGQVLVVLDTAKLQDQVNSSRAALASAQAQVAQATATLKEAKAQLERQEEVARLSGGKVPSAAELDSARAAVDRAVATEASARAAVQQAQATLSTNETNFSKASIRSPIDGVVLTRSVDPGNAVAASLQAVTLFSIAQDLKELRLEVYVDEADVGVVKPAQKATFTVSSYPNRRYPAEVTRVDYGSTKTENVVTYVTTLDVDNADLSLRPGMTATASIVATERKGVLLVPNTALRFTPPNGNAAAQQGSGVLSKMFPRMPSSGTKTARAERSGGVRQIWVLKDGQPQAMQVTTGISDGRNTEVSGEGLQEGMAVITGLMSAEAAK